MKDNIPFKATIIEASAGTGKTKSIVDEILNIIKENDYEILRKIVAITFSEKAAIELKERLLREVLKELVKIPDKKKIEVENILLRLNISTIHSFAKRILKRLFFMIGIDPFFKIIEERESDIMFSKALSRVFSSENKAINIFYEISKTLKLDNFSDHIFKMKNLHPYVFLGNPISGTLTNKIREFYEIVEKEYSNLKNEFGVVDFDDLEKKTYCVFKEYPESLNFLEDFDEKINFIFVDEFQDTNLLQWEIINKLIEEWISGYGAKAETGEKYGIFLVGDKKQSIYKFRGAERSVFEEAKKVLNGYYLLEKRRENYRSSKKIIEFVNKVFQNEKDWKEEELIYKGNMEDIDSEIEIASFDNKEEEYEWVCGKICNLIKNGIIIKDKVSGEKRKIQFRDIAILIRKRGSKFELLEETLKKYKIPYIILGGIGFYQEIEIKFLLSLLYALVDPTDSFSLWNLENSCFKITPEKIEEWRKLLDKYEISSLMENILAEINFMEKLNTQQIANVEKFLSILQGQSSLPYYQIAMNFRKMSENTQEPKADIFSIHQDAVKIMTVHGAKGLEFPVVFLINAEDFKPQFRERFIYKKENENYVYALKSEGTDFENEFREEMRNEEKRIFYVGLTRAQQYLFISWKKNSPFENIKRYEKEYEATFEKPFQIEILPEEKGKILIPSLKYTNISSFTKERKLKGFSYKQLLTGTIVHKIIYEIGTGILKYDRNSIKERVKFYLNKKTLNPENYIEEILEIFEKIEKNEDIKKIIEEKESENVKCEYPFIGEIDGKIYEGVVDKFFISDKNGKIYEFKIQVREFEEYKIQVRIYSKILKEIFKLEKIDGYIIDLSRCKIIKV